MQGDEYMNWLDCDDHLTMHSFIKTSIPSQNAISICQLCPNKTGAGESNSPNLQKWTSNLHPSPEAKDDIINFHANPDNIYSSTNI